MKHIACLLLPATFLLLTSCSNAQTGNVLQVDSFAKQIERMPDAMLIDVRTPEEFDKGHLANALNISWNAKDFDSRIALFDKKQPVMVYCLSGGRSGSAARKLRKEGFETVYDMEGGMLKWRAANLPEIRSAGIAPPAMTREQFDGLLSKHEMVLIDFYADWCIPCGKMKPYLDEIEKTHKDKVTIVRINADESRELCKQLNITSLPTLLLYKHKQLAWTHTGFIGKNEVVKILD